MATIETTNPQFTLAPGAKRALGVTWRELLPDGVTLSSLAVSISPTGLTLGTPSVSDPIGSCTFQAGSSEAIGTLYTADFAGTWSDGQIDVRTLYITIAKKS